MGCMVGIELFWGVVVEFCTVGGGVVLLYQGLIGGVVGLVGCGLSGVGC